MLKSKKKFLFIALILFCVIGVFSFQNVKATEEQKPNLYPTEISTYQTSYYVNQQIDITGSFFNSGTIINNSFSTLFTVKKENDNNANNWTLHYNTYANLGGSAGKTIDIWSWTPKESGNYIISLTADIYGDVDESNENNNILTKTITIEKDQTAKPDLIPTSINAKVGFYDEVYYELGNTAKEFKVGEKISIISGNYKKDGGEMDVDDASNPFKSRLQIIKNDKTYYDQVNGASGIGTGKTGTAGIWGWTPTESGTYSVILTLDKHNVVAESNENNNILTKTITIEKDQTEKPDLIPTSINAKIGFYDEVYYELGNTVKEFKVGEKISIISGNYKKDGGEMDVDDASNPFKSRLQIIKNNKTYYDQVNGASGIGTGKTGTAGIWGWTPTESGTYDVTLTLDKHNVVEESNENNNILTKKIIIGGQAVCTTNYTPVCGADGKTYSNRCVAENQKNIEVAYEGECGDDDSEQDNSSANRLVLKLQRKISQLEKQVIDLEEKLTKLDKKFAEKYAGTMFLDVENKGRLWYVDPASKNRFYFENGESALSIGSKLALGITYEDIQKIPVGVPDKLYNLTDTDGDGLPDRLEAALGSDPGKADTDNDGYSDKQELQNGYNPVFDKKYSYDQKLIKRLEGKMLLQVSGSNSHGEIWYIHKGQRWYGGTKDSMFEIMKARSLGAKTEDIRKIEVGEVESAEIE